MRIFLLVVLILLTGCTTVNVHKHVSVFTGITVLPGQCQILPPPGYNPPKRRAI